MAKKKIIIHKKKSEKPKPKTKKVRRPVEMIRKREYYT